MSIDRLFSLQGKTALVTGGATGIGKMAVKALMLGGAHVMIVSRKGEACEAVADALNAHGWPGTAEGFAGDVGSQAGVDALVAQVHERCDKLHILMNNAGTTWGEPLGDFPYQAWDKVMAVNLTGLFQLTQALLPLLREAGSKDDPSRIVNVGSVMGDAVLGDGAYSYSASKAAVHHITRILAKELANDYITCNALAPGPFVSNMTAFATANEDKREKVGNDVPLNRVGNEDDIAGCLLFLCGRGGSYITGAVIPVSGGIQVMSGPSLFDSALT